ncbi:hypothetical protein F4804DRAFT_249534 [Jackrogersella minutella]|nr:hypothetical protein F4804DRAFT_249534 [Jackrogersella minutella]
MAHYPAVERKSVISLDNDHFYSAPSSRRASRRDSLMIAPRNLEEETTHGGMPSGPPVSICQPGRFTPVTPPPPPPPPAQSPPPIRTSKSKWAVPLIMRHHHNPKHRHFCPKPLGRRFHRSFHGTSESIPLLQPLTNESSIDINPFTSPLISSPASPIVVDRWSSVCTGSNSPRSERSHSSVDPINIDRQGTDAIVSNIRAYLSGRRHNNCSSRTGVSSTDKNHPPSKLQANQITSRESHAGPSGTAAETYLVTTDDIAGILEIVVAGIRSIHRGGSAARCLSMLLPKEPLIKPSPNLNAIIPGSPSIADPATTITSVQPSFSMSRCSGHHSHYLDASRTTFISRQSITEVT